MEPEGSLPYSQLPATCPYPEPVPTTPSNFLNIHLNIILPSTSGSPQRPLSLKFPHQPSLQRWLFYVGLTVHHVRGCIQNITDWRCKNKKLILRPISCHLPRSSSLPHADTRPAYSIFGTLSESPFLSGCQKLSAIRSGFYLWQRFSNCGQRTTSGPRVLPLWSS
jgi:hypothetical protein